ARLSHPAHRTMRAGPPRFDLGVLAVDAAEAHEQTCMLANGAPVARHAGDVVAADDIGHDGECCTEAVVAELVDIAAEAAEEALEPARGRLPAPGPGPAVRSAVNGRIAMRLAHAQQLPCHEPHRLIPFDGDVSIRSALGGRPPRTVPKVAAAHEGLRHPQ